MPRLPAALPAGGVTVTTIGAVASDFTLTGAVMTTRGVTGVVAACAGPEPATATATEANVAPTAIAARRERVMSTPSRHLRF